jgi:hypothetical protein
MAGPGSGTNLARPSSPIGEPAWKPKRPRAPDDEHLARLLAAAIVADVRRFPPADSWDIIAAEVKAHPSERLA